MLPLWYRERRACCIGAQSARPIKLNPVQERLGRRVERAPDHGALGPVQEERVVHDADSALHVVGGVPRESIPGGGCDEIADAGPGFQCNGVVAEFGDSFVQRGAEHGHRARMRDEVHAEGAGELLVRGADRLGEELARVTGEFQHGEDGGQVLRGQSWSGFRRGETCDQSFWVAMCSAW